MCKVRSVSTSIPEEPIGDLGCRRCRVRLLAASRLAETRGGARLQTGSRLVEIGMWQYAAEACPKSLGAGFEELHVPNEQGDLHLLSWG